MAAPHARRPSTAPGGTHALSLKVLRLSRPALAPQTPLPITRFGNGLDIAPSASLACPPLGVGGDEDGGAVPAFPLAPLLTLPSSFGAAYVGETFACTLCANDETDVDDGRSVSGVKVAAVLQTPGKQDGVALELEECEGGGEEGGEGGSDPGGTLQRTLRVPLKEEGMHVLAVTVSYTETFGGAGTGASGGRARTFRKLYQFAATQAVAVRSKVSEKRRGKGEGRRWVLEAQLENVCDVSVVIERAGLIEREGILSVVVGKSREEEERMVLKPQDVQQVMFGMHEEEFEGEGAGSGRVPLAQLKIDWRSPMGERGTLTTGWLASRGR